MRGSREDRLLADLFLKLKGPKKKGEDWVSIATKVEEVAARYGSTKLAAEKLGVSYELIRSIRLINQLPPEVKDLVREGKILYDAAQRLARIRDPRLRVTVASAIQDLPSHDAREIIQFARRNPKLDANSLRKRVLNSRTRIESRKALVLLLSDQQYQKLRKLSRSAGSSPSRFLLDRIDELGGVEAEAGE